MAWVLRTLVFLLFVAIIALFVGIAALYIATGKGGFEDKRFSQWLNEKFQSEVPYPYELKTNRMRFVRGEGFSLALQMNEVRLFDTTQNKELLFAPRVNLGFDVEHKITWKAAKRFFLTKIDIDGLKINFEETPSTPTSAQPVNHPFSLTPLTTAIAQAEQVGFNSLRLNNLSVKDYPPFDLIAQETSKHNWQLQFLKPTGVELLSLTLQKLEQGHALTLNLPQISLQELNAYLPQKIDESVFKGKAKGKLNAIFNANGEPQTLKANAIAQTAQFEKKGKFPKIYLIPEAEIAISWAEGRDKINVDKLNVDMRPWNIALKGVIDFPKNGQYPFFITQGKIDVYGEKLQDAPVTLDKIALKGTANLALMELNIDQAEMAGPLGGFNFTSRVKFSDTTPAVDLDLKASQLPAYAFLRLWPEFVSPKARQWLLAHMKAGIIEPSSVKLAFPEGILAPENIVLSKEMMEIKANIRDVTMKPLDALPEIKAPFAEVFLDGTHIKANVPTGTFKYEKHEAFALSNVQFLVPDTAPEELEAKIHFKAASTAEGLADLLKIDLFKGVSSFSFDSGGQVRGQANTNFDLSFPLRGDITKKDVIYKAELEFNNFSQQEAFQDFSLEQGKIKVLATNKDFSLKGEGKVAGTPAFFEYKKLSNGKKPQFNVQTTLDDKGRAQFGLSTGGKIQGRTPIKIHSEGEDSGIYKIEADLTNAKMNELIPGWVKPAGQTAKAKLTAVEKDKGWRISDLHLEGRNVLIKGAADFDDEGTLLSGNFPTYHLNDGDKASVRVERIPQGYKVFLNATLIDIRAPMRNLLSSTSANADKGQLQIEAKVNIATGFNGEVLRGVTLKATRVNGEIRVIEAKGKNGQGDFNVGMIKEEDRNFISVATADAGAWLRFLDIYKGLYGGNLRIAFSPPKNDGGIEAGSIELRNFSVRDSAFSSLAATSEKRNELKNLTPQERQRLLQETARQANLPTNTQFTRMKANFSKTSTNVLNISEGLIWGPALGSTLEGNLDFRHNKIALTGTYVPAYALNNMFAKIPVIGLLLGANPDEGLIGVSYDITGSASKPELIINPLTAIAPGFLRKLVDFRPRANADAP